MKTLLVVLAVVALSGCATSGVDNSFGARASRGVMATMAHEMCPYGVKKSQTKVGSQIRVGYDSSAYYRDDTINVREEYRGRRNDECLPPPTMLPQQEYKRR